MLLGSVLLLGVSTVDGQDWPQWRGPNRDNKLVGFAEPKAWPKALTQKWKVDVGKGESSPVLAGDKIYTHGRKGGDEVILCVNAMTGEVVWTDKYATAAVNKAATSFRGPRSTPAVGEGKVCTLGVNGVVSCLDAEKGNVVWRKDTGSKPQFNTSTSPIILDGMCIVYVNGLTAYDLANGNVKWTWSGPGAPYGSPVLATIDGVKQIITPNSNGALAGVSLDGKLLWQYQIGIAKDYMNNYSTPVVGGSIVYYSVTAKGGKGTVALQIEKSGDKFTAKELWKKSLAPDKYSTPLLRDGLLFGVSNDKHYYCMNAKTGDELWQDKTTRGECGSIIDAGSVLVSLTTNKELVVFQPSDKGFMEVAKYNVANGETWAEPILSGNRIYIRDRAGMLYMWVME
jgi:outer membrane protein assembly factor BamB